MYRSAAVFCAIFAIAFGASLPPLERIVDGANATIAEAPFTVSVHYLNQPVCNGALVSRVHVITSASCVAELLSANVRVRYGSSRNTNGGNLAQVGSIMVHPNYTVSVVENDIAVLRLRSPITGSVARPIAIANPERHQLNVSSEATLAGWQSFPESEDSDENIDAVISSEFIQIATLVTVAQDDCTRAYGSNSHGRARVGADAFCATNTRTRGNSACTAGSPLFAVRPCGRIFLHGIASWSNGCGNGTRPGVFTQVNRHSSWIRSCNCPA